jgi:hypothetical protein
LDKGAGIIGKTVGKILIDAVGPGRASDLKGVRSDLDVVIAGSWFAGALAGILLGHHPLIFMV